MFNNSGSATGQSNPQPSRFRESVDQGLAKAATQSAAAAANASVGADLVSARTADGAQSLSLSEVSQNAGGVVNSPAATQSTAAAANASVGADLVSARTSDGRQTGTQPGSTEQQTGEMTAAEQEAAAIPETTRDILLQAESILRTEKLTEAEQNTLHVYRQQSARLEELNRQRAELARTDAGNDYFVSAGRKAGNRATGESVTPKGFVGSGESLTIDTDRGSVSRENISYADEDQAVLYESILNLGIGDADYANFLLKAYTDNPGGVRVGDYVNGMRDAFVYGQHNIPVGELIDNSVIAKLTPIQRNTAYHIGRQFAGKQTASAEAVARQNRIRARIAQAQKQESTKEDAARKKEKADTKKASARTKSGGAAGKDSRATSRAMPEEQIARIQGIGRKSFNKFSQADTRAAGELVRRYWNELGKKSPFYRAQNGDWRANDRTPVQIANLPGDTRGVQTNIDTGWDIQVSGKVFNESRHAGAKNQAALPYLANINDIVRKAILLDSYAMGQTKSGNSLIMHSLYAVADIGNGPQLLKLFVEEMRDPNKPQTVKRAYQLQNIENSGLKVQGSRNSASPIIQTTDIHTVADLFSAVKALDSNFSPKPVKNAENPGKTGGVYYGYEGKTIDQRTGTKLSKKQQVGVDFAKRLADSRGMTIYFYESYMKDGKRVYKDANGKIVEADNGFYDPKTGAIHIDLNAGEYGQGTVLFTIAHELTHFIKDTAPAQYKKLCSLLMKGYKAKGQSVSELVAAQQARAEGRGEVLSFDEAYDEVIADSMESILADGRVMELMRDIEAADKGLLATVKKFFRDVAKLIKQTIDAYKGVKPDSAEGRMVQQMEDIYGQLQEVFAKGVYEGGEAAMDTDPAADIRQRVKFSRKNFSQDVDTIVDSDDNKPFDYRNVFMGETPQSLLDLGFAQLPMTITSKHIYTIANSEGRFNSPNDHYHALGAEGVKQLLDDIKKPIVTFVEKDNPQRVVMITVAKGSDGNPVMAAVECSGQTNFNEVRIFANPLVTAFGKKSGSLLSYIQDALDDGRMLQADKKRSQEAPSGLWAQCPEGLWSSDFTTNIERFKQNVKRFLPKEKQIRKAWHTIEEQQAKESKTKKSARSQQNATAEQYSSQETDADADVEKVYSYEGLPADAFYNEDYSYIYSYDFLTAQKDMTIVDSLPTLQELQTDRKIDPAKVLAAGYKNILEMGGTKVGDTYSIINTYTNRPLQIGKNCITHGLGAEDINAKRTNARLAAVIGELCKNAIPICALPNTHNVRGTYGMAVLVNSRVNGKDMNMIALITVEQQNGKVQSVDFVDVAHAVSGRLVRDIEKENRSAQGTPPGTKSEWATRFSSTLRITQFLEIVNRTHQGYLSDDVISKLGEERRGPKKALYSSQETDADNAPTFYSRMGKVVEGMKQESGQLKADVEQRGGFSPQTTRDILLQAESILRTENLSSSERSALQMYNNQLSQLHSLQQQRAALQQQLQTGTRLDVSAARKIQSQISTLDAEIAKAETALYAAKRSKRLSGIKQMAQKILAEDLTPIGKLNRKANPGKRSVEKISKADIIKTAREEILELDKKQTISYKGKRIRVDTKLVDLNRVDNRGRTNLQRMKRGLAPVGPDGKSINLHHVDQTDDGEIVELAGSVHKAEFGNLHDNTGRFASKINRAEFGKWRRSYWKNRQQLLPELTEGNQ